MDAVRERLQALSRPQLLALSELSGVPYSTVDHIRRAHTLNPGVLTVAALLEHVDAAQAAVAAAPLNAPRAKRKPRKLRASTAVRKVPVKTCRAKRKGA